MPMPHEATLCEYFAINRNPQGWTSFEALGGRSLPGFKTKRVAKSDDGKHLCFTIGETERGRAAGLAEIVEIVIRSAGLPLHRIKSTNGQVDKTYVGFDLTAVDEPLLRSILRRVAANVDCLTV
jgi:hypothetical protein